ncbi:fructosamine kinase [Cordyceps javanica]|uniref:protein-ribulosamine 3-kinase n=1 Tax=Cordyceps javanica TaxID=43265 RepID=A0A545UUC4_9HYPO|nr:fructosamine kinase [Cordyceps javanica]
MNYHGQGEFEFGAGNTKVDPSVQKGRYYLRLFLPCDAKVTATEGFNVSFWARTGRIDVERGDGTSQSYFIKVISTDVGRNMVMGEFESMKTIHSVVPGFVPRPIAWGQYATIPDTYFYLCEYREMIDNMPDPADFTRLLARLHQDGESPSGRFGFHTTTYAGNLPQRVGWEDSWEVFFAKSMRYALDLEIERNGQSAQLSALSDKLFARVIPRLLRPLESNGRSLRPSLVHGDLWYANSGIDVNSGQLLIFDACCFYAHHECKSAFSVHAASSKH